ncbi:MAG: phosphoribosyltransferase [Halobacteriaceae archaeon]
MFDNREQAGEELADLLMEEVDDIDIVLGIPRGGLPVARPVADAFDTQLDIIVAKKLGAPGNPERAIGAVAADGSIWLDEDSIEHLNVSEEYVTAEREKAAEKARKKAETYRTGRKPSLENKRVLIVDDGVATGATAIACLRKVRQSTAESVMLAVPVASPRALKELEGEADRIISIQAPEHFRAVGQFYRSFEQVSDEQARVYLRGIHET